MIRFDNHAFKGLDEALTRLFALLQSMGEAIGQLATLLPEGLEVADPQAFQRAKEIDKTINEAEQSADALVAEIINKYTVIGEDLRFTLGAIKVAGTLERVADKLKNCIKRLGRVHHPMDATLKTELRKAMRALQAMIPLALTQLLDYQAETTQQLLAHGAAVQESYRAVLLKVHGQGVPTDDVAHLLLVAKNIEQASDMAVEIMKISHMIHFATKYDKHAG